MSTRTITAKVNAYFTSEYVGPEDLKRSPEEAIHALSFYKFDNPPSGWTLVGEADITINVLDEQTLVENKVEALRAEKTRTLADAQAKATEIEGQIQKLLAITYSPEVVL